MNIKMKTKSDISISLTGAVLLTALILASVEAAPLSVSNDFTDGNVLKADELNVNFVEVEEAVNDNDTKVGILERKSPAIGRLVVPVVAVSIGATISGAQGILPDAQSTTAFGGSFGMPTDYVSGDVTVKAVVSGCAGSIIAHRSSQPSLDQVNIGANTGFFILACIDFGCPTVSIPPNINNFPFPATSFAVEVVRTYSSISDINTPAFGRLGTNLGDACTGSLTVEGFIIEYPRG